MKVVCMKMRKISEKEEANKGDLHMIETIILAVVGKLIVVMFVHQLWSDHHQLACTL